MKDLYEAIGFSAAESFSLQSFPDDYVKTDINFNLGKAAFR